MADTPDVTVLAGGVGAARFLSGLSAAVDPTSVTAVVNTGDDTWLHGLRICPDLDTVTYTLAGAIDPERGWGLRGETWNAMVALERYGSQAPEHSSAGITWFGLGDRDLATHLYRTARLAEGASLSEVTDEIAAAWQVPVRLVPMSDQPVATHLTTTEGGSLTFQEYFVKYRHEVPVRSIEIDVADAQLGATARAALETARAVVIAPSNPLVSIGPIRALPGVDQLLAARRDRVVAVSPIVGGAALKGPAARMLTELGHAATVVGVARLYRDIASVLVIDRVDAELAAEVRAAGIECVVTDTVMSDPAVAAELARVTLASLP